MIDLAFKNLIHDKIRFLITVSGVAFSVLLVTVQASILAGLMNDAVINIRRFGADLWITSRHSESIDFPHFFSGAQVLRVRSVPGVARADNLLVYVAQMVLPSGAMEGVMIYALENPREWNFPWETVRGYRGDLERGDFIMIDESSTRRLGNFGLGEYREVEGRRFQIIGTTRDARSFIDVPIVFMNYGPAESLMPLALSGTTAYVVVKLLPGADPQSVARKIRRLLPYNDVYTAEEWAKRTRDYWLMKTALGLDFAVTVFLGCLVGVVVVAQTLYTSTMEHSREYGTLKSIGCSNRDIYAILVRQATIDAAVGFVIGIALAAVFGWVVKGRGLALEMTPALLGCIYLGTLGLCVGAAMLSFRKVSSIDPALVFRN